ncbi:hypothetical protein LCGC14_1288960, partial [marine sediment metagenome]
MSKAGELRVTGMIVARRGDGQEVVGQGKRPED